MFNTEGLNDETKAKLEAFPVSTYTNLKELMFANMIIRYLKEEAKLANSSIYNFNEMGKNMCQVLLENNEVTESMFDKYEHALQCALGKERLLRNKVIKKFMKGIVKSGIHETVPIQEFKQPLQKLAEVCSFKAEVKEEIMENDLLQTVANSLYNSCLEVLAPMLPNQDMVSRFK